MKKRRKYELKKRAERQEATRRRITEAAVELHSTVGPARTTITAIAERAGVQRHTVYSHFPTESELFRACSRHGVAADPPPDPSAWREIADPEARLTAALGDLYGYYGRNEEMLANVLRDATVVPAVWTVVAPQLDALGVAREVLAHGWRVRGGRRKRLLAAVGHALEFETWRSLVRRHGLNEREALDLMAELVRRAAGRSDY